MSASLSISDLAKVICPPGSSRRVMALLRAYCDASFSDPRIGAGWTAVAGYIGSDDEWSSVQKQWIENKRDWGIREFSIANILAGEVAGVGRTKADLCVGSFGKIINGSSLQGVSAAIKDADFEQAYKSDRFPTPYHMCVSMLFHIIDQHMDLEFRGDHVAIVLDTDAADDDALRALVDEWKVTSPIIASVTWARRSQFPVLECADLCAGTERNVQIAGGRAHVFHANRWFSLNHAKNHRGIFWSFEDEKRVQQALDERERRRRQREGEG